MGPARGRGAGNEDAQKCTESAARKIIAFFGFGFLFWFGIFFVEFLRGGKRNDFLRDVIYWQ